MITFINSAMLFTIAIACVRHLNRMRTRVTVDIVLFAAAAAGAAGLGFELWWPGMQEEPWWLLLFHGGIAGIAFRQFACERRALRVPQPSPEMMARFTHTQ